MNRPLRIVSSLHLTLYLLGLSMVLVFVGTLHQVDLGAFAAQKKYFDSFFIYWTTAAGPNIPVFPGGLTLGILLLINLIAAHTVRFRWVWKKAGIWLIHLGIVILIIGQLATQTVSRESQMAVREGASSRYSEDPRRAELAVILTNQADVDEVTAIPQHLLRPGVVAGTGLPFELTIEKFHPNARVVLVDGDEQGVADRGPGRTMRIVPLPVTHKDDEVNEPALVLRVEKNGQPLGRWLLSPQIGLPQGFDDAGDVYRLDLRRRRTYYPFSVHLLDFRHDKYPGTEIPMNFSSKIILSDDETAERREVLIYMNHPLRYRGNTFYQASFAEEDTVSIFQVVRNPAWQAPYLACLLTALGLLLQFGLHLIAFLRRRK